MKIRLPSRLSLCCAALLSVNSIYAAASGVSIEKLDDRLRIELNGELFTEYHYKDVPKPFMYPIIGPDGASMTRNFPMKDVRDETQDHPHHRALFYGHGRVNGIDFWAESARSGKTVHQEFLEIKEGAQAGVIRARNHLVAPDGTVVGTDERTIRIHNQEDSRMIDFDVTLKATHGDMIFGDTKEGTMAIRLPETMVLRHSRSQVKREGDGHIVTSEGVRDQETWGKRAKWVDYYGPANGQIYGVAIFDHPENPRHPTWWHVRDYGLFAANPFGVHDFEKLSNEKAGELKLPAGESITFRYRFYFHRGDEKAGNVESFYNRYAAGR